MAQQIQIRRDTSSNWSSVNPTLAQGELGLETNTGKVKIGDGTTAWNSLSYFGGAGALASLTDVNINSLASGQVVVANASGIFINKSLSSLIGELAFASLGSLAFMNQLSFTSLTNQPSLSSLAFQSTLDYTSGQLTNKPSLGSLAPMNQLSFTSLLNQPSLSSLAFQSTVDYPTQVLNKPSLGSLAIMDQLSFTSLLNQPSLGSLAFVNSLTKSDVGLSNVTNDAQLKIASNLSDLNNVTTARANLSLGSLAVLNSITAVLPSTASVDILFSNGIVNSSTVSTNLINTNGLLASTATVGNRFGNNLAITSTISTNLLYANGIFASAMSIGNLTANNGTFVSTISTNVLNANQIFASTISTGLITSNGGVFASTVSINNLNVTVDITAPNVDTFRALYGSGADGVVYYDTFFNTYPFSIVSLYSGGATYTLTRDVHATAFGVGSGSTVITAGYRIFATQYIACDGVIRNDGANATGATAGAGALGGFFRAGTAGVAGHGTGAGATIGLVPTSPASGTMIGQPGGRGASARTAVNAQTGTNIAFANYTTTNPNIGSLLEKNLSTYFTPFITSSTTTNIQLTPSLGGGSGAKSTTGTTATSGGGGGGGGIVFLSSPSILINTFVSAVGGNGGNATGTGGIFGGGGGGGGGIVAYVTRKTAPDIIVTTNGGTGGNSAGTANTIAVTKADNTFSSTATLQAFSFVPTQVISPNTQYILSVVLQANAGLIPGGFSVEGLGCSWNYISDLYFSSLATPTRRLIAFEGSTTNADFDVLRDNRITVSFDGYVNNVRAVLDEIQNTARADGNLPINIVSTFTSDSSANPLTNFGTTPTTNNTQYSVIARAGGTALTAGTGCTLINNQTTAPLLASMVAVSRVTSNASYTTAGAVAMMTIDINQPSVQEKGDNGYNGKTIRFNV